MSLLEQIKPEIDKHQVISFDIFDTLLLRPYVKPTDLFLHLEILENAKGFAKARIKAEKQARKTHSDLEDINIDEIYDEIADKYKGLKEKEMALEAEVLTANPEMKEVYDYAIKQKKKIVIISDMYLPDNFLHDVLTKNGYTNFRLYVSGDKRKKKGTGTIYQYALKKLNIEPKNMLHIGDNKRSDYEVPLSLGIFACWYEQVISRYLKQNEKAKIFLDKYEDNLEASVMIMSFALHWLTHQDEDFWSRIGYEYGGPMCYAYMRWVEQQVLEKGIKEILFVARDGYSLQKVFDSFGHKDIKTHYVYAPRQVFVNCFIDNAIKNKRELFLLKGYSKKNKRIAEAAISIKDRENANKYINENIKMFREIEKEERQNYATYIKNLNIGTNACIVDTTSSLLSSVNLLSSMLKYKPISFFWILYEVAIKQRDFKLESFCYEKYTNKYIKCWDFYEYMMTAPEPPVDDVNEEGAIYINPIPHEEMERIALYENVQKSILEFNNGIQKYKKLNYTERQITEWINILFQNYDNDEYEHLSSVAIAVDTAHENYRSLFKGIHNVKEEVQKAVGFSFVNVQNTAFYSLKYNEQCVKKKIKFLNLPIIKIVKSSWFNRYYFLGINVANYKYSKYRRNFHILGFPIFKIINNINLESINVDVSTNINIMNHMDNLFLQNNRILERKLSTFALHQQTFPQFKGINRGKDVVIVATGPSLSQFKPIKNAVYIGVNRAIQYDKVHYDYYFVQDYSGATPTYIDEVYRYQNCIKFMGFTNEISSPDKTIPQKYRAGNNTYSYRTDWEIIEKFKTQFTYDLATTALGCGGTVVLPALQFALWTHPKRIYLVGCDTTTAGYFDNKASGKNFLYPSALKDRYKEIKAFAHQYYPDVEIISINPVGLKGIFKDEYQ